ncbi:MAG: MFS transporter [Leptospiraceae bacterium]|nr:MFS transporter [Leptospiraceae bacterium]MCP5512256.1 MFS transporter [Leptospiraceae bacterium]
MTALYLSPLVFIFLIILFRYFVGLKNSPRELWILFATKLIEFTAFSASNLSFALYLSADCGLSDMEAGSFIGFWSVGMTLLSILVGSIVDAIGIKNTLRIGTLFLLLGRIILPLSNQFFIIIVLGFFPLAIGNALLGPVLSVGIKRYTRQESMALGFGLFYTLMNVGWALGGFLFDRIRSTLGEHSFYTILPGVEISTYQIIFLICFVLTIPSIILVGLMKEEESNSESKKLKISILSSEIHNVYRKTINIAKNVFREKEFWIYLLLLGSLVFVRLTFYHFNYTSPKYGIRVLGEGARIGNLFGVLNPVMIIFLVPLFSELTKKIKSYSLLITGSLFSSLSILTIMIPGNFYSNWIDSDFGRWILIEWLDIQNPSQYELVFSLLIMIFFFTIGEAIWSPRLMQFSTEIAPVGKEGSYIALSYLPYFLGKILAGPISGYLLTRYTPEGQSSYPEHFMVWVWVGLIALLSPLLLFLLKPLFLSLNRGVES